jgi:DNA recombination protein Rad52
MSELATGVSPTGYWQDGYFDQWQIDHLTSKLDASAVKTREQSGRTLSYVEGWHVIAEANRIFGFGGWDRQTLEMRLVSERERKIGKAQRDGWSVTYCARVIVRVGSSIEREGWGSGHGIDVDLGLAHESALKEAETDAMKRAFVTFGNVFGLALYDKERANVRTSADILKEQLLREMIAISGIDNLKTWWANTADARSAMLDDDQRYELKEALRAYAGTLGAGKIAQNEEKKNG